MMFRLKTTLATFQGIIMEIFTGYIIGFIQALLDDFNIWYVEIVATHQVVPKEV